MMKENQKRLSKAQLLKLLALLGFLIAVIAFSSIAWFASNKNVAGNGMSVTVAGVDYIISVDAYDLSGVSPSTDAANDYRAFTEYYPIMTGELQTQEYNLSALNTSSADSIRWCLKEGNPVYTDHTGLRPGSYGVLTFYVEPVDAQSFSGATLHFDLSVIPYANVESTRINSQTGKEETYISGVTRIASTEDAYKFLNSHLIFFEENNNGIYSKMIDKDAGFSRAIDSSQFVNGKQEIDVYWIWPNTFSQMVLFAGTSDLNDDPMFASTQTATESYTNWQSNLTTTGTPVDRMKNCIIANYDGFFKDITFSGETDALRKADVNSKMSDLTNNIILFNTGYNNADQIIGTDVRSVMVELNVGT